MVKDEAILYRVRNSGKITVVVVFSALILDNMLLTAVVPIIPDYLAKLDKQHHEFIVLPTEPCLSGLVFNHDSDVNTTSNFTEIPSKSPPAHKIIHENGKIGALLASKAVVQLLFSFIVGSVTNRIGYNIVMVFGNVILLISSLIFAFGESYVTLFVARSVQGIGSLSIVVSGMGMVANRYCEDDIRSRMMGYAMGGIGIGVLAGYPFGSTVYQFVGKRSVFVILAGLVCLSFAFQVVILNPRIKTEKALVTTPIKELIRDPYVLLSIGAICVSTSSIALLESCLPVWLMERFSPPEWQLGTVFIPDCVGYFIGAIFFGPVSYRLGRWITGTVALLFVGGAAFAIPMVPSILYLIAPHFLLGLGIGVVDSAFMPLLAHLVDRRYSATYGTVYALAQLATSLAYCIGPLTASYMADWVGFTWVMRAVGIANVVYCPLCFFLRHLQSTEEGKAIVLDSGVRPSYAATTTRGSQRAYSRFVDDGQED